jgi:hypothetical protein
MAGQTARRRVDGHPLLVGTSFVPETVILQDFDPGMIMTAQSTHL